MSSEAPKAQSLWIKHPSGLFVPVAIQLDDNLYLPAPQDANAKLRKSLFRHRMVATPDYDQIWRDTEPDLPDLFNILGRRSWVSFLARLALALVSPLVDQFALQGSVSELLGPEEARRLNLFLSSNQNTVLFNEFPVLLAMQLAAVYASDRDDGNEFTPAQRDALVKAIVLISNRSLRQIPDDFAEAEAGYAAMLAERSILGDPRQYLTRAFSCWLRDNEAMSAQEHRFRSTVDETMRATAGVSLRDWISSIAVVTLIHLAQDLRQIRERTLTYDPSAFPVENPAPSTLLHTIERVSCSWDHFCTTCKGIHTTNALWDYPTLEPLAKYPCVRIDEDRSTFQVLSPLHLAQNALEYPYFVAEQGNLPQAGEYFARLIESHTHAILKLAFGNRYEKLSRSNTRKRADGIIWYEDGFVVVECKAGRRSAWMRYQPRDNQSFLGELQRRDLPKAVEQVEQTTTDVQGGLITIPGFCKPRTAGSFIVVIDALPLNVIAESLWTKVLPATRKNDDLTILQPQIIGLPELEIIDQWSGTRMLDVLREKMSMTATALEGLQSYMHLKGYPAIASAVQNKLLDELTSLNS